MKQLLSFLLVFIIVGTANAQTNEIIKINWDKTIGGNRNEGGLTSKTFILLFDSRVYMGGTSNSLANSIKSESSTNDDYWAYKLEPNSGNIIWENTIKGNNSDKLTSINSYAFGTALGGISNSTIGNDKTENSRGGNDYWIVGVDADGVFNWDKTFGTNQDDLLVTIIQSASNTSMLRANLIAAGNTTAGISGDKTIASKGGSDVWLVEFETRKSVFSSIWTITKIRDISIGSIGNDYLKSMLKTDDKGYLLGIQSNSIFGDRFTDFYGGYDYWLVKLDSNLNIEWQKSYGGSSDDYINQILDLDNGNFLLVGTSFSGVSGNKTNGHIGNGDTWVIKINSTGNILWQRTLGSTATESEATSIRIYNNDERKNYYIIASTATSTVSGNKTVSGYGAKDIWIVKLNETGEIVSQGMLGGEQDEYSPTLSKGDLSAIGEQDIILACVSNSNASGLKTENNYGGGAVNNETDFWTVNFNFEKTNPTAPLTGKVYNDFANDCNYVFGLDQPISGFLVRDNTSGNYCVTNQNGEYQLPVDSGSHEIELLIPHQFENIYTTYNCPTNGKLSIDINNIDNIPVNNNFFIDNKRCAILNIDISSDRRRRCLKSLTVVNYSNIGNENANNVKVYVQMPEFVRILAANKPYTQINENTYEFLIDNIAYGQSGIIRIVDETLCESGIAGLTQCTKAWITPKNECFNNLDTAVTSWDKSSIAVSGSCTSYRVQFVIKNNGEDMQDSSEYRIYQNSQLGRTANFKLLAGDSIIINLQNNGATYRIEADQSYGHPGNSHPTYTVEACAMPANRGYYNDLPQDDEDYEVAEQCLPIIDSYDPNDKQVQPKGSGENGQLYRNSTLHYTIRFQNTGTDTAYKVVVIDTLDANLDITTLMFGASSHTYDFEFVGNTNYIVLKFTFNDINLPDSTTNELASNGFLSFSIKPYDTISNGITIQNNADIYFDFNDPIKTNTTSNLMDDRFPTTNNLLIITAINNDKNSELVQVYPNPFSNAITFSFKQNSQAYQIQIISIDGKAIKEEIINSNIVSFGINNIANGMYYYKILDKKGNIINNGKLVKQ